MFEEHLVNGLDSENENRHPLKTSKMSKGKCQTFASQNMVHVLGARGANSFHQVPLFSHFAPLSRAAEAAHPALEGERCRAQKAGCLPGSRQAPGCWRAASLQALTECTFSVCFLTHGLLSMPLTVAGVLLSCTPPHCLLCLSRVGVTGGGSAPGWTR